VRATGGWVVLEVADEGPGVPEGLDDRVFERSVSGAESSGLGLGLARTLVAADGGRLEMLSARPAVFAMFLRTDPHATTGAGAASVPVADPAAPERAGSGGSAAVDPAQAEVAMASSSAASTSSGNTQRR
jgi:signal transduction histidine kinase